MFTGFCMPQATLGDLDETLAATFRRLRTTPTEGDLLRRMAGIKFSCDVSCGEKGLQLKVAIPGVPEDQVKVEVSSSCLSISIKDKSYTYSLAGYDVSLDDVTASLKLGVLTVTLPTQQKAKARAVPLT